MTLTKGTLVQDVYKLNMLDAVACIIKCTKVVYNNYNWLKWADNWLNGRDRLKTSAFAAGNLALNNVTENDYGGNLGCLCAYAVVRLESDQYVSGCWSIECASAFGMLADHYPKIFSNILFSEFLCPKCHLGTEQHLGNGKCLFGPYFWKDINNAYKDIAVAVNTGT